MARYIDADLFIKNLQSEFHGMISDESLKIYKIIHRIDDTPTADVVEVKHGEYIYSSTDDKWHCSECFAERPRNNGDIPYSDIYCCYKCGAKMDGRK